MYDHAHIHLYFFDDGDEVHQEFIFLNVALPHWLSQNIVRIYNSRPFTKEMLNIFSYACWLFV